jgi:phospholipase C
VQTLDSSFWILFRNTGEATAVFQVRSGNSAIAPRTYTVEAHKSLTDFWSAAVLGGADYDLSVYGPNGFFRSFKGGTSRQRAKLEVRVVYDCDSSNITLHISNRSSHVLKASVFNAYTSKSTTLALGLGDTDSKSWTLSRTGGWYDLTITVDGDSPFVYQLAGHLEDGEDSISDPIMGGLV